MNELLSRITARWHDYQEDHHEGNPTHSNSQKLPPCLWKTEWGGAGGWRCNAGADSALCHLGTSWEVAVSAVGLGVLGCKPLSFRPAQGTHSPNRKEPVEREMWSDNRCSRKRGKKLLLKWQ